MDTHEIEIVLRDGDASWCTCACGWTSEKLAEDVVAATWAAHVAEHSLTTTSRQPVL